jgi:autotransporter-associated beta strand protein
MYGPGTLTLSGNNSGYAGSTIISGGVVQASSIGSSPLTLFGGGQFVDTATGTITSGAISLAGNATLTLQNPYSGVKGSGNVAVSGTNNVISLGSGWTKAGTYTLLSGTTLTGTVTSTSLILKAPFGTIPVNSAPVTYNGYSYTFAAGPNSVNLMIIKQ